MGNQRPLELIFVCVLHRLGFLLVAVVLSGCAPQIWAKPGGTSVEFEATKAACNAQSYSQFPPMPEQLMIMAGYMTPVQTTCTGGGYTVNCFSTGGNYVPPAYVTVDQNLSARNSGFRSCLMSAGWQPVKNQEEAATVTNSLLPVAQATVATPLQSNWDAVRADCRKEATDKSASDGSLFPNAFNACMKSRGL
jgi:hypothetical protein